MSRSGADSKTAFREASHDAWLVAGAGLALVGLSVLLALTSFSVRRQFQQERLIRTELLSAYEYRSLMRSVLIDLQDAETGQRGYLLTGREVYLVPYRHAQQRVDGDLRALATAGSIGDPRAVDRLSRLSRSKLDELAQTISLRREGKAAEALALVQSDRGERDMEAARDTVAADRARTEAFIESRGRETDASARTTERSGAAVGALIMLTLAAAGTLIGQILMQRRRTIVAQRRVNDEVTALLRTSEIAERVSDSGHWSLSPTGEHQWSPGMFPIFGLSAGDPLPSVDATIEMYAEEDRSVVQAQMAHALEQRAGFAFEAEIVDAQGRRKRLRHEAEYVPDAVGVCLVGAVHDVTAERATQTALEKSEERYRHLAESSTDMMATMSPDSTILFVSPACRRILGYEPEELIGRQTLSITHPDDVSNVLAIFDGLRRAGPGDTTLSYRFRGRHKSGIWVWLEGQPRVEFDAEGVAVRYQDVVREISSRKAAEDALETSRALAMESERRYRLLAENATDMIARYGLDGAITYVSPACKQVLGYSAEEMIGRSTLSMVHPDDLSRIRAQFRAFLASKPKHAMHTEHRVIRRDGAVIWLEGRARLVCDEAGEPLEYNDVMRDITARKALESQLRDARSTAEAAAQSKADFLANMSHELRTPLNSVVGFSGLIAAAPELTAETRHRADVVRESSRALAEIVNDILDFSKFEAEGVTLSPEAVDPLTLLRSVIEIVRAQADAKGLKLCLDAPEAMGAVLVDQMRLRQVLFNLLGNAIKFTSAGQVTLAATEDPDGGLTLSVSDSGVGIPEDRLGRVFERFAQADASTSRRFGGTGLGLAICTTIVQAMGGEMKVRSVVGHGSTFSFTIHPPRPIGPQAPLEISPAPRSTIEGLRVLVADDNVFNQELFEALMQGRGLEITFASNGREAVQAVKASQFDLVLMDMQMPVMDGLEATREIRRLGQTLPVVALTANVIPSQIELCLAAGMNDHLAKPYAAEDAAALISRWTGDRKEASRSLSLAL